MDFYLSCRLKIISYDISSIFLLFFNYYFFCFVSYQLENLAAP